MSAILLNINMSTQASVPDNKNFLSPIGFRFSMQRLPHVNYFCSSASIPNVSLATIENVENPFVKLPVPGSKLTYNILNLRFHIDEDMKNYQEIFNWLVSLGFPDSYDQHPRIQRASPTSAADPVYSDGSLMIMTNQYKPNIEVKFTDMYPVDLSSVEFDIAQDDIQYLSADVTFAYRKYELITVE